MRIMISILAGFFVGFLGFGSLTEWLLDVAAGRCDIGCAGWRHVVFLGTALLAWVIVGRFTYLWWNRTSPPPTRTGPSWIDRFLGGGT